MVYERNNSVTRLKGPVVCRMRDSHIIDGVEQGRMPFSGLKSGHWFSQEKRKYLLSCSVISSVILRDQENKRGGEERH